MNISSIGSLLLLQRPMFILLRLLWIGKRTIQPECIVNDTTFRQMTGQIMQVNTVQRKRNQRTLNAPNTTRAKHQTLTSSKEESSDVELEDRHLSQVFPTDVRVSDSDDATCICKDLWTLSKKHSMFLSHWLGYEFVQVRTSSANYCMLRTIGFCKICDAIPTYAGQISGSFLSWSVRRMWTRFKMT